MLTAIPGIFSPHQPTRKGWVFFIAKICIVCYIIIIVHAGGVAPISSPVSGAPVLVSFRL